MNPCQAAFGNSASPNLLDKFQIGINYEKNQLWQNVLLSYQQILEEYFTSAGECWVEAQVTDCLWLDLVDSTRKQGYTEMPTPLVPLIAAVAPDLTDPAMHPIAVFKAGSPDRFALVILPVPPLKPVPALKEDDDREDRIKSRIPPAIQIAMNLGMPPNPMFLVLPGGDETLIRPAPARYRWLAAHIGNAGLQVVLKAFQFLPNTETMVYSEAVWDFAREYIDFVCQAVSAKPDDAWSLAHFGEYLRIIANSWFSPSDLTGAAKMRVVYYKGSLALLERAVAIRPDYIWANAHLAACIVNMRAFLFGSSGSEIPEQRLSTALSKSERALKYCGAFYPWGLAYLAGVQFLKSFTTRDSRQFEEDLQVFIAQMLTAFVQKRKMLEQVFEAGAFYNSSSLAMSQMLLWHRRYRHAWGYAGLALNEVFDTYFIPHLVQATLYSYLAFIVFEARDHGVMNDVGSDTVLHTMVEWVPLPLSIPPFEKVLLRPAFGPDPLDDFISGIYQRVFLPGVEPVLCRDRDKDNSWSLLPKFAMGLTIFATLLDALAQLVRDDLALRCQLEKEARQIRCALGMGTQPVFDGPNDVGPFFKTLVTTGNFSKRTIEMIQK